MRDSSNSARYSKACDLRSREDGQNMQFLPPSARSLRGMSLFDSRERNRKWARYRELRQSQAKSRSGDWCDQSVPARRLNISPNHGLRFATEGWVEGLAG